MKKAFASLLLVVLCAIVTGFFLGKKNVVSNTVQSNVKDLADDGLILIDPASRDYDKVLAKSIKI